MKENYKPIGDFIRVVNQKNKELEVTQLIGLSIDKCYIPSVANVIGTDLSTYKIIKRNQFACSLMQVSRDGKIPIACMTEYEQAIMSPAYVIFEIVDETVLLPEYLGMWVMRTEFDREASFLAVGGVRGSLSWDDFCRMKLPVPAIEKQRNIVNAYKAITERIALKKQINDNLEAMLTAVFFDTFSPKKTAERSKLSELMSFGNGKSRPKTDGTIPVYGGNGVLSYTDQYNIENAILVGRVGAYCGSVYLEQGICWVSDNAIFAKSKLSKDEFFDYFLLKSLNLFNHHVGTGQQLLTQEILNNIEVAKPDYEQIEAFNDKAKAVYETITANKSEIVRFKELSDLLLSRLAG